MKNWFLSYHLAGFLGLIIYLPLIIYIGYKLLLSFIFKRNLKKNLFNYKLSFHFVFFLTCLFEIIYCFSMFITNRLVYFNIF